MSNVSLKLVETKAWFNKNNKISIRFYYGHNLIFFVKIVSSVVLLVTWKPIALLRPWQYSLPDIRFPD